MEEAAQGLSGAEELHVQTVVSLDEPSLPPSSIRLPKMPAAPMGVEGFFVIERKLQFFHRGVRLQQQRKV